MPVATSLLQKQTRKSKDEPILQGEAYDNFIGAIKSPKQKR